MQFGLNMECDYIQGKTEDEAFKEVFAQVDLAEAVGLDGVWLAERHFASGDRGQPSIASAPSSWPRPSPDAPGACGWAPGCTCCR